MESRLKLEILQSAKEMAGQAVLISGTVRSGTTILGKVIHSFQNVEYAFEPPMLNSLIPMIDKLPEKPWKMLYETYLYEEILINGVSGRSINCNLEDDSSIYRVKSTSSISDRLERSFSKLEASRIASNSTVAFKLPNMGPFLLKLQGYYPRIKMIILRRSVSDTLNSLMRKHWFSDEMLDQGIVWPFYNQGGIKIPFWFRDENRNQWVNMSEIDRCAYYYLWMNRYFNKVPDHFEIDYDEMVRDPLSIVQGLADYLELSFGPKTEDIIASICPTDSPRRANLLDSVSPDVMADLSRYLSEDGIR